MTRFGEYNEDGSIKVNATVCVVTGRPLGSSAKAPVPGTRYFYRMRPDVSRLMTKEQREAIHKDCLTEMKVQATASKTEKVAKVEAE